MKKFIYALPMLLLVASCGKSGSSDSENNSGSQATLDSLQAAVAERDSLLAFVAEVNNGMDQLLFLQGDMDNIAIIRESPERKAQFSEQVGRISYQMQQNKDRLAQLEQQLQESKTSNSTLLNSISTLKKQIANQEKLIQSLTQQLDAAGIIIANQGAAIDSLNTTVTDITAQRDVAQERGDQLNAELNKCYYVYATKDELKKNKIIETGFLRKTKVLPDDFEKQFFLTADKTNLTTINTHAKKAQVLTKQPTDSYVIEDVNGQKVVKITNPTRFWEKSNFLVIQVD